MSAYRKYRTLASLLAVIVSLSLIGGIALTSHSVADALNSFHRLISQEGRPLLSGEIYLDTEQRQEVTNLMAGDANEDAKAGDGWL